MRFPYWLLEEGRNARHYNLILTLVASLEFAALFHSPTGREKKGAANSTLATFLTEMCRSFIILARDYHLQDLLEI